GSLLAMVERHPALCATFTRDDAGEMQMTNGEPPADLLWIRDLDGLDAAEEDEAVARVFADAQASLSLERGPLARAV
ncbi:hypothetical protein, partial [Escherichia coli]|uniref:hypothetical protein n=1 Tax=Escherichia coli TaxID=562 RepID=UPI0028DD9BF5